MRNLTLKQKAELAEFSYNTYEIFLHKIFMDKSYDVPERNKIMLYCFLNKGISLHQTSILFGNSIAKKNSISMIIKRLRDKDYLLSLNNLQSLHKSNASIAMHTHMITAAGIKYCMDIIPELFSQCMSMDIFENNEHGFTLHDILEYLSQRCLENPPIHWRHYLGSRDINTYLLSSPFAKMGYRYETEVFLNKSGIPQSVYLKSYLGVHNMSLPVRSDALLTYPLMEGEPPIKFFIEVDTGSQRSSVLNEKVQNYKTYYLDTLSFSPLDALVFCLSTSVKENNIKIKKEINGTYGVKNFYYLFALEFAFDLLNLSIPDLEPIYTVGDALSYLNKLKEVYELPTTIESILSYFTENEGTINKATALTDLKTHYYNMKNERTGKRASIIADLHQRKYLNRRSILHKAVSTITGLDEYFLKGFSLYTISNHSIDKTLPYILPEMFQFKNKLKQMLLRLDLVNIRATVDYQPLYNVDGSSFVLRNSYTFVNDNVHVIVENITDDLGGMKRFTHLLNQDNIPLSLASSKILCLYDIDSQDEVKEMYLSSKLGKALSMRSGSSCSKDKFEVYFATYDCVRTGGNVITFSSNGDIIYKTS